jgi:hypothetical protein
VTAFPPERQAARIVPIPPDRPRGGRDRVHPQTLDREDQSPTRLFRDEIPTEIGLFTTCLAPARSPAEIRKLIAAPNPKTTASAVGQEAGGGTEAGVAGPSRTSLTGVDVAMLA